VLIEGNALIDLRGLDSLTTVVGQLTIIGKPDLASLAGLGGLTQIGTLTLQENPVLTDPLQGLQTVNGNVVVCDNTSLTDAAAQALIDAIESITGTTQVSGNE